MYCFSYVAALEAHSSYDDPPLTCRDAVRRDQHCEVAMADQLWVFSVLLTSIQPITGQGLKDPACDWSEILRSCD